MTEKLRQGNEMRGRLKLGDKMKVIPIEKEEQKPKWYGTKAGNDYQGIVLDENTGETIALIYNTANTQLIASAPDMLQMLTTVSDIIFNLYFLPSNEYKKSVDWKKLRTDIQSAIEKATA